MNPWNTIHDRLWYYLEEGPKSSAVTAIIPQANRFKYDSKLLEATPPMSVSQPTLTIDQTGGKIDLDYSPRFLRATEDFQITLWTATLDLSVINDHRLKILAAVESGLPDLGASDVLDVSFRTGRVTLSLDKVERDADGRLMPWRKDIQNIRSRAVLLEITVTFLIDKTTL